MVEPPNLFIDEHVEVLVETVPPSVERQVTVSPAFCSCITSAPEATVFVLLLIEAVNPASVPDIETESSTAASVPVTIAIGAKRTRFALLCEVFDTVGKPPDGGL